MAFLGFVNVRMASNLPDDDLEESDHMVKELVKRGDIFYADLSPVVGSEQGGMRPVLVIQNNIGNKFSPTVIVAAITSKIAKPKMLTHVAVKAAPKGQKGLEKDSVILLEQLRTLDKQRLRDKISHLDDTTMRSVDYALKVSIGLIDIHTRSNNDRKKKTYKIKK